MQFKIFFFITFGLSFFFTPSIVTLEAAEVSNVRAKIGIQIKSGERISMAKSKDKLKAGDLFRIYVNSEENCVIYIIHTDEKLVSLLNITEQKVQSSTIILPSAQAYYQADGKSNFEKITIVCSPYKLPELTAIENNDMSLSEWSLIQDDLTRKSEIIQPIKKEKPFVIAGNVRGIANSKSGDPFVKRLQIYSGKGMLVKNYEFKVKK